MKRSSARPAQVCRNPPSLARVVSYLSSSAHADDPAVNRVEALPALYLPGVPPSRGLQRAIEGVVATLGRGAHLIRNGERLVGAVEEFDGHKDHLLVAEIFEVVDLVLTQVIGLVAGL